MDVILSGRRLSAREALTAGLVARVVAKEAWLEEAKRVARDIAEKGPVAARLAKESVDRAYETSLSTEDITQIEKIAGEEIRRLGYTL